MSKQQLSGIVLMVLGVVLFIFGMNARHSVADRWSNFFTGHFTDATMWYILGGIAAALVGLSLLGLGGRKAAA